MWRIGIKRDFALFACSLERCAHLLYRVVWNAAVGTAVKPEHWRIDLRDHINRVLRLQRIDCADYSSVPRATGSHRLIVCSVKPRDTSAPAKAGDSQLVGIGPAGGLGVSDAGVEIGHHLRVRHFAHDLADDLRNLGHFRHVALSREQLGRNRKVAELGEAAAHILDVLMHAKNFLYHEHDRETGPGRRHGAIRDHIAVFRRHFNFARDEAVGGRGDGLRRHRQHRRGETCAE